MSRPKIDPATLSPRERALLFKKLNRRLRASTPSRIPQLARNRRDFTVSFAQQRLWFLDQLEGPSATYNILVALRLRGILRIDVLSRVFARLIERHEGLRTVFELIDETPRQVVLDPFDPDLPLIDLGRLPPEARQPTREGSLGHALIRRESERPFDLASGPLIRLRLLRLTEHDHVFLFAIHHIISDAWSIDVLVREFAALYGAGAYDRPISLPEPPIQYVDFAAWQRDWLQGEPLERQMDYWRERLEGLPPLLDLPTDFPRPQVQTYRGELELFTLPKPLSDRLSRLCRRLEVTPFMLLLAAYAILLWRLTGQADIAVGSSIAGRNRKELEGIVGFFINTLTLRNQVAGHEPFERFLARVKANALGAYGRQDIPFEHLVSRLKPERDLGQAPIFQTLFELQNAPVSHLALPGLAVSSADQGIRVAKFDLTLMLRETPHGVEGSLEYNTDLFLPETVRRWLGHYLRLLEGLVDDPACRVDRLPFLSSEEKARVLTAWNRNQRPLPDQSFIQLFEARVAANPDATAVRFQRTGAAECQLSYGALNARANRMAAFLAQRGVGPETATALLGERGVDFLTAILAIFKAGGAYLPLDPSHPADRTALTLSLSKAPLALVSASCQDAINSALATLPDNRKPQLIFMEEALSADLPADNPPARAALHQLAYVIFTSGSTGAPKGAMVEQLGMLNHILAKIEDLGMTARDTLVQNASQCFDISVWQFLSPLLIGGRVRIVDDETAHDPELLLEQCRDVSILEVVPSFLQLILDETPRRRRPPCLRRLVPTGEALPPDLCRTWLKRFPAVPLVNAYGPTECSDDVTHCVIDAPPHKADTSVPIGAPVRNMRIYILDTQLQPTPWGVPGELCVAGVGVGRGYLHNPEKTAETFTPSPFGLAPGERLYKTGDLGRCLPDGRIVFLGRTDFQVKIRGFRIELGEIESALRQQENVRDAAVLAREKTPALKTLVAYIVSREPRLWVEAEVRARLKSKLPEYMIPAVFVTLDAMPLTANGKLDRKRLPAPDLNARLESGYLAPRTPIESTLAQIWAELLGLERVGVADNFFEIGGDSIVSIQMIARAKRAGYLFSPRQLFEHQTIAELAPEAKLADAPRTLAEQGVVAGPMPLLPIQIDFFEQDLADISHYNQALLFQTHGALDLVAMRRTIAALLKHHDALRLRFERTDSGWRQQMADWDPESTQACLERLDFSEMPESRRKTALVEASARIQASLNIFEGPLMRVAWFDYGADAPGRLLIAIHHLVMDGVSWRILLQHLQTVYLQASRGEPVQLPEKTTSYKAWAERLAQYARTDAILGEVDYWRGLAETPTAPYRWDDDANTVASSQTRSISLSEEETEAMLKQIHAAYNTEINDVLLTALALAYRRWTEARAVWITLEGHGREDLFDDLDVSQTVGWFTVEYPVCLDPPVDGDIGGALKAVKELLRRIPKRGLGYGLLNRMSDDPEARAAMRELPTPSLVFNYLGRLDDALAEEGFLRPASESPGPTVSERQRRAHPLELVSMVSNGKFQISCAYSRNVHDPENIGAFLDHFRGAVRETIDHCLRSETGGATPSDFPEADLSQREIDRLYDTLDRGGDRRNIQMLYPLSPLQQGMMFHSLLAPNSGVYVEQIVCALEGDLDVAAFRQAWTDVLAHQPVFRTLIAEVDQERQVQVVRRRVETPWRMEDWRDGSEAETAARFDQLVLADRLQGYDFLEAPLMRLILVRVGDRSYKFIWSHHHVLTDGWSLPLVLQEVFAFYEAARKGRSLTLPPARPYRDYIRWLARQDAKKAEAFWRNCLQGFEEPTPLVVDQRLPEDPSSGSMPPAVFLTLDEARTQALQELSKKGQATLNILMQGLWALLLHRYSGEPDIVFGAIVSGRPPELPGVETMVGPFINTLPVRVQIDSERPVLSWLKALHGAQADRARFEYTSLIDIQRWSEVAGSAPLFESLMVFENYPVNQVLETEAHKTHLKIENMHAVEQTNYPLTLVIVPGDQISIQLKYNASRLDENTGQRILEHFQVLLDHLLANPLARVPDLPILTVAERDRALRVWNSTETPFPQGKLLEQCFREQVKRTPDAPAVIFRDQVWSYRQLHEASLRLARRLSAAGVRPNQLVGVCLDRGWPQIVAVYAALYAGGAYLPLDPRWPAERRNQVVIQAEAEIVIAEERMRRADDWPPSVRLWTLEEPGAEEGAPPLSSAGPEDLAYVIFTSGSTGMPKGVAIQHRAVVNTLFDINQRFEVGPEDRVLALSALSFDLSVYDIFGVHGAGGAVVVPEEDSLRDPGHWLELLSRHRVTLWDTVPALMQMLVDYAETSPPPQPPPLRLVMMSGDWIPVPLPDRIRAVFPDAQLISLGGATEASIWSISYPIATVDPGWKSIPYGRPLANQEFYVLDRYGDPCPVGVPGDLHIGGIGLAQGYWRDPDKTNASFFVHPRIDKRLYRTGDLGRYGEDGLIEFLGRSDFQVKINGFRIELGEIEAALRAHPALERTLVVVREDQPGVRRLVGYGALQDDADVDKEALRAFLEKKLPDYMIPSAFVLVARFPLTGNGKVDRSALPAPGEEDRLKQAYVAPRTAEETAIAEMWSELLGVSEPGIEDNFFEIGGDSILATRLVSRMRNVFSREVPMQVVFESPTIIELARRLETAERESDALPPLVRSDRTEQLPLSFAQHRLWVFEQMEGPTNAYNVSLTLRLEGALIPLAFVKAMRAVIHRHESLRTRFVERDGVPAQIIAEEADWDLPVIDLSGLGGVGRLAPAESRRLAQHEVRRRFDLAQGPLFRAVLIRNDPQTHALAITMHHIVTDGWSMGVMVRDFVAFYAAEFRNAAPSLPELPIQYADFAVWQRSWMTEKVVASQIDYWRKRLADAQNTEWRADKPRPAVRSARGAAAVFVLADETAASLKALSQREGVTLFMTLLAAFQVLQSHCADQTDVVVGSDVANRERAELENLIGFFINQIVLRVDLAGVPTFRDLLEKVRTATLEAYANQNVPFEMLLATLKTPRDASRTPLFQTKFVLQNAGGPAPEVSGLKISDMAVDQQTAKFDLLLSMEETAQGLSGSLEYSLDLFEKETAAFTTELYRILLERVAREPETPLGELKNALARLERERRQKIERDVAAASLQKLKRSRRRKIVSAAD